jgi:hypothetical protein
MGRRTAKMISYVLWVEEEEAEVSRCKPRGKRDQRLTIRAWLGGSVKAVVLQDSCVSAS